MITIIENGNIFESKMQTITNTVNCNGVMGCGLALQFKKKFPEYYEIYRQKCNLGEVEIGKVYIYKKSTPWILTFPTKTHWRWDSQLWYIENGLDFFVDNYENMSIISIAIPALGCNNGKLDWNVVKPIIIKKLEKLPIEIELYAPLSR